MVTAQLALRLSSAAFSSSAACPAVVRSLLSYSKNAGLSGDCRLRSSSELDVMFSARTGSGGTMTGSRTGSGGAGGRGGAVVSATAGGGGDGRATGGFFLPQANAVTVTNTIIHNAAFASARRIVISIFQALRFEIWALDSARAPDRLFAVSMFLPKPKAPSPKPVYFDQSG